MTLPSKNMLLEACAGASSPSHPVARVTAELAALHRLRSGADARCRCEIDCARILFVREIDRWTASQAPIPVGGAYLHTESVGMIIDRIARYHTDAHAALNASDEPVRHYLWTRLSELVLAYTDLASEIDAGLRKLPVAGVGPYLLG